MRIDERPHTIVGVMPPGFTLDGDEDLPAAGDRCEPRPRVPPHRGVGSARGVTLEQARDDMSAIAGAPSSSIPTARRGRRQHDADRRRPVARRVRLGLDDDMLGVVGVVLLIACANVAGLMLARGAARQQELARSRRARRRTRSPGAAAPDREHADRRSRRGARPVRRALDRVSARRGGSRSISCSRDREYADRWHGAPLHNRRLGGSRPWVRRRAGVRMPSRIRASAARGGSIGDRSSCATRRRGLVVVETALALVLLVGGGTLIRTFLTLRATPPGFEQRQLDQGGSLAAAAQLLAADTARGLLSSGAPTRACAAGRSRRGVRQHSAAQQPQQHGIVSHRRQSRSKPSSPGSTPSSTWRRPATSG